MRRAPGWGGRAGRVLVAAAVLSGSLLAGVGRPPVPHLDALLGLPERPGDMVTAGLALASAVGAWLAPRRLWPLFSVAAVAWLTQTMFPALFVASYTAATVFRRSHLVAYAAVAGVVVLLPGPLRAALGLGGVEWADALPGLGAVALYVALPMAVGLWVVARRELVAGLRERAESLRREQEARVAEARARERARIAREMHDVVAHQVSLVVLRAGALRVDAPDDRVAAYAEDIRTTAKEALTRLREVLGVLRAPGGNSNATVAGGGAAGLRPQPSLRDLETLLEESRAVGIRVERHDEGPSRALPATVEHAAYRVVQEALTNARKHAGAAPTEVALRYPPDALVVTVRNAAPEGGAEPLPGGGMGLAGLRERVELLGGQLEAGPSPGGGFLVRATLPAPGTGGAEAGEPAAGGGEAG